MPKASQPPKSKKRPRNLPEDPVSRAGHVRRTATKDEVGDVADKITRAPKKKTRSLTTPKPK
jgi:hypothetical protein